MRKKAFEISKSTIILVLLVSLLSGLFGATAATKLFNSNEVGYNNSESGIEADDVQGAIDELYAAATTYETLANRIATLETHITGNSTSRLREYGIELNDTNGSTTTGGYIDFHWQGNASDYTSRIIETANGVLNLSAVNGVKANGKNIMTEDKLSATSFKATSLISGLSLGTNQCYKSGNVYTCTFHIQGLSSTNFPSGQEINILQIPTGYKPNTTVYFTYGFNGEGVTSSRYGYLSTSGEIGL